MLSCQVWMGEIKGPEHYMERYSVDAVYYADELADTLRQLKPPLLHVLSGTNSDRSGLPCLLRS